MSLTGSTNKRVDKRFTFASLSHPKFVTKLKVALLFFSSNSCDVINSVFNRLTQS